MDGLIKLRHKVTAKTGFMQAKSQKTGRAKKKVFQNGTIFGQNKKKSDFLAQVKKIYLYLCGAKNEKV